MTYKEKYREKHPGVTQEQMEFIIQARCPDSCFDLEDEPGYCNSAESVEKVCPMCWEREFPEEIDIEKIINFLAAQQKAEEKGEHSFVCPLCGGRAHWERADLNGHVRCSCDGCGMKFVE